MDFALCPTWPAFVRMTHRFFRDLLQWCQEMTGQTLIKTVPGAKKQIPEYDPAETALGHRL